MPQVKILYEIFQVRESIINVTQSELDLLSCTDVLLKQNPTEKRLIDNLNNNKTLERDSQTISIINMKIE